MFTEGKQNAIYPIMKDSIFINARLNFSLRLRVNTNL
jgi:hypothetical protein